MAEAEEMPELAQAPRKVKEASPLSCIVAEVVGTFLLVFTVGCCHFAGDATWDATAIACIFMVAIYAFGAVSGGHFNPAVSFAMGLTNNCSWSKVFFYTVAQLIGGMLATFAYNNVFEKTMPMTYVKGNQWWCACVVETIYTFMLCFVALNVMASKRNNPKDDQNHFYALAIGFVIVAGGYACGGISGAAFNPAVAISVDVNHAGTGVHWGLVYSAYELLGAVAAALLYATCRPEEYEEDVDFEAYDSSSGARLLSEFVGTFLVVLTFGLCLVNKSTVTAWSAAACVMCMIYALGNVSGGHFNPAVTVAVMMSGRNKCSTGMGAAYIATQILAGAMAGVAFGHFHNNGRFYEEPFGLQPQPSWSWVSVAIAELSFTFVLAFVFLACTTVDDIMSRQAKHNFFYALCVGSSITAGGFAVGAISLGVFNPAVSVGIAAGSSVASSSGTVSPPFHYCINYSFIQMVGGVLASHMFRITHADEYAKDVA